MRGELFLVGRDVLVDDALNGTVSDQFFQRLVYLVQKLGVLLGNADSVLLIGIGAVQDHETLVNGYEGLGGLVVDNNNGNLAGVQRQNCIGTGLVANNIRVAKAPVLNSVGSVDISGGVLLNANLYAVLNGYPVARLKKSSMEV